MNKLKIKKSNQSTINTILSSQSKRIEELKKENAQLSLEIEKYRQLEKEIGTTLSFAKNNAENILSESKIRYALEGERLKIFRKKWTSLISNNPKKLTESIDKTTSCLRECQIELENMLSENLGDSMESYIEERERIDSEPTLDYQKLAERQTKNIEELSDSELEELLKQL